MRQELILILAMCAFTAAMVPRERRAVDTEEHPSSSSVNICASNTPCAWSLYNSKIKFVEQFIKNSYCTCETGTVCSIVEDDSVANSYVHKCVLPSEVREP